jgi:hypothetical protein
MTANDYYHSNGCARSCFGVIIKIIIFLLLFFGLVAIFSSCSRNLVAQRSYSQSRAMCGSIYWAPYHYHEPWYWRDNEVYYYHRLIRPKSINTTGGFPVKHHYVKLYKHGG